MYDLYQIIILMMKTISKDRVLLATLISNHNARLLFPMYEFIIHLLLHACYASEQITLRLQQSSKAGDQTLVILRNLLQNCISVMAPKKSEKITRLEPEGTKLLESFP
jgi:hypothetical protein